MHSQVPAFILKYAELNMLDTTKKFRLKDNCCIEMVEQERIISVSTARSGWKELRLKTLKATCRNKSRSALLLFVDL